MWIDRGVVLILEDYGFYWDIILNMYPNLDENEVEEELMSLEK